MTHLKKIGFLLYTAMLLATTACKDEPNNQTPTPVVCADTPEARKICTDCSPAVTGSANCYTCNNQTMDFLGCAENLAGVVKERDPAKQDTYNFERYYIEVDVANKFPDLHKNWSTCVNGVCLVEIYSGQKDFFKPEHLGKKVTISGHLYHCFAPPTRSFIQAVNEYFVISPKNLTITK